MSSPSVEEPVFLISPLLLAKDSLSTTGHVDNCGGLRGALVCCRSHDHLRRKLPPLLAQRWRKACIARPRRRGLTLGRPEGLQSSMPHWRGPQIRPITRQARGPASTGGRNPGGGPRATGMGTACPRGHQDGPRSPAGPRTTLLATPQKSSRRLQADEPISAEAFLVPNTFSLGNFLQTSPHLAPKKFPIPVSTRVHRGPGHPESPASPRSDEDFLSRLSRESQACPQPGRRLLHRKGSSPSRHHSSPQMP